jgi:BolA protein
MGAVAQSLSRKLTDALAPLELRIVDQSALHAAHAGAAPGGETHFDIAITAGAFVVSDRAWTGPASSSATTP